MSDGGRVRVPFVFSPRDCAGLRDKEDSMASSSKRKTTMAKLNRERRLLERRLEKKAKKDARTRAAALESGPPSGA